MENHPSPLVVKTAVDSIVNCLQDMEAVFENTSFEDIEIPRAMIDDIVLKHENTVKVEVTTNPSGRRRDEDDHYEYLISVPEANAFTYVNMDPPIVYDPYESHGEDDDDDEDEKTKKVQFEWHNRTVHVQAAFGITLHIGHQEGRISVWFKEEIPEDSKAIVEYIWTIATMFRCPMVEHSMRHRHRTPKEAMVIRKVNRLLASLE
jgi:hypothetical protein